jgi:hypothetical protein
MHKSLKAAVLALAISGAAAGVAYADSVTFSVGDVAIGYSDGYWDRAHQWHAWERTEHRDTYRAAKNAEYHEWKHDRDKDMGWHERK